MALGGRQQQGQREVAADHHLLDVEDLGAHVRDGVEERAADARAVVATHRHEEGWGRRRCGVRPLRNDIERFRRPRGSLAMRPGRGGAHVVPRPVQAHGEQPRARGIQPLGSGRVVARVLGEAARPRRDACGALDLVGVPPDPGTPLVEDPVLVRDGVGVAEPVPDVCVLGHDAQSLALAATPDQHRDVAGRPWVEALPPPADAGQVTGQGAQPPTRRAELVAVLVVVPLEPPRADAQDEPAAADVVDGAGHVGQQVGVAVRVAGDQGADLDPLRRLGPRRQRGPALEVRTVPVAVQRVEVVPGEGDVDADRLGLGAGPADVRVGRVLRLDLHAHPDGTSRAQRLTSWPLATTVKPDSVTWKPRARSCSRSTPIVVFSGT